MSLPQQRRREPSWLPMFPLRTWDRSSWTWRRWSARFGHAGSIRRAEYFGRLRPGWPTRGRVRLCHQAVTAPGHLTGCCCSSPRAQDRERRMPRRESVASWPIEASLAANQLSRCNSRCCATNGFSATLQFSLQTERLLSFLSLPGLLPVVRRLAAPVGSSWARQAEHYIWSICDVRKSPAVTDMISITPRESSRRKVSLSG